VALSNSDSYVNWYADYSNNRCIRQVNNSYSATKYGNWKVNGILQPHGVYIEINGCRHPNTDIYSPIGTIWVDSPPSYNRWECVLYKYTCPSGGDNLNNSTCKKINTEYKSFSSF
jgi:hypothetical protein